MNQENSNNNAIKLLNVLNEQVKALMLNTEAANRLAASNENLAASLRAHVENIPAFMELIEENNDISSLIPDILSRLFSSDEQFESFEVFLEEFSDAFLSMQKDS